MDASLIGKRGVALFLMLLVNACGNAKEIIGWPGMEVAEFNRINQGKAEPMNLAGSDWIGVNSPVTLIVRSRRESIKFVGTRRSGGLQIVSGDVADEGAYRARIQTIAFNIGAGMEDIETRAPWLAEQCDHLARMAGLQPSHVQAPSEVRRKLRAAKGSEVELCAGEGSAFVFSITASHDDNHWQYGSDYNRAYLNGFLGEPMRRAVKQRAGGQRY